MRKAKSIERKRPFFC